MSPLPLPRPTFVTLRSSPPSPLRRTRSTRCSRDPGVAVVPDAARRPPAPRPDRRDREHRSEQHQSELPRSAELVAEQPLRDEPILPGHLDLRERRGQDAVRACGVARSASQPATRRSTSGVTFMPAPPRDRRRDPRPRGSPAGPTSRSGSGTWPCPAGCRAPRRPRAATSPRSRGGRRSRGARSRAAGSRLQLVAIGEAAGASATRGSTVISPTLA